LAVAQALPSPEFPCDAVAQRRLGPSKRLHILKLELVAILSPLWVIEILLTTASVNPGCLEVRRRLGSYPNGLPSRRYGQTRDALQIRLVIHRGPVVLKVRESAGGLDTRKSWLEAVYKVEPPVPVG
jgi:hypothetical protein